MGKYKNLEGVRFDKLVVIKKIGKQKDNILWLCKCDCGNYTEVITRSLTSKNTRSCGCLQKEKVSKVNKKYNTYDLLGEYGVGYTSNTNEQFYFDLEDYEKIKDYCWRIDKDGYIRSREQNNPIYLHRIIMNPNNNQDVDHINHLKYDNRKINLRLCNQAQNSWNMKVPQNNKSGVKGVYWNGKIKKWMVQIGVNNKRIHLGYFDDFDKAVDARRHAEVKYYGEFTLKP